MSAAPLLLRREKPGQCHGAEIAPIGADIEQYETVKDMLVRGMPSVVAALQVAQARKEN